MDKLKIWLGQVTTAHGMMVLAPSLLAVMTGQMTWQTAAPLLAAGLIGLMWPENKTLQTAVQTMAKDGVTLVDALKANVQAVALMLGLAFALSACGATPAGQNALASAPGQLFCSIQTAGGGSFLAALVDAEASALAPAAAPIAVLATNALKADVDDDCAQAAKNVNGVSGNPVSPPASPAMPVQTVAVDKPWSPVAPVRTPE